MYLVFSRFGPISTVKASRDYAHRPFGFIEFISKECCMAAIDDFKKAGGIIIGGRRIRLELAKSTTKLLIQVAEGEGSNLDEIVKEFNLKTFIPTSRVNEYLIKIDARDRGQELADKLARDHPDWSIQLKTDSDFARFSLSNGVAESSQRQSGLFQLRIPDSGVLPVSPTVLAKINYCSPGLQYAMTPVESFSNTTAIPNTFAFLSNRLFEDWNSAGHQVVFTDPTEARQALLQLEPPMGESACDVFIGRLDNQKVTVIDILEWLQSFGQVEFLRLCNRAIVREDRVPVDSTSYVRFENEFIAQKFIQQQNGAAWMGRIIKCERCWNLNSLSRGNGTPVSSKGTSNGSIVNSN